LDQFRSTLPVSFLSFGCIFTDVLTNLEIAELLAREAESAKQPVQRALRRASRRAFLWPEEAADIYR